VKPFLTILLFAVVAVCLLMPARLLATRVLIELEAFVASHDIAGEPIREVEAASCSSGYLLKGLDTTGEWVEYPLTLSEFGTWVVAMRARGDLGAVYQFRVEFTSALTGAVESVLMNYVGRGYG